MMGRISDENLSLNRLVGTLLSFAAMVFGGLDLTCHFFSFGGGHFFGVGGDAYPTQVESVRVEACVDGGVAGAMGHGMQAAGLLECFELLVGQVFQQGISEADHQFGGSGTMLFIVYVVDAAAVVQVGEESDDGDVAFGCGERHAVTFHAFPVRHAVGFPEGPSAHGPLFYLVDVDHGFDGA